MLIRLTSNDLTENFNLSKVPVDDLPENILFYDEEPKLYIPGCKLQYYNGINQPQLGQCVHTVNNPTLKICHT